MLTLTPDETEREAYATGRHYFTRDEYRALLDECDRLREEAAKAAETLTESEDAISDTARKLEALRGALRRLLDAVDRDGLPLETEAAVAAAWKAHDTVRPGRRTTPCGLEGARHRAALTPPPERG